MTFSFFKNKTEAHWVAITDLQQLDKINAASFTKPQLIFKHSTTCSISRMAKNRMEDGLEELGTLVDVYYLDLLTYRSISNEIAKKWNIQHESPQVILIKNGQAIYDASHNMVIVEDIKQQIG